MAVINNANEVSRRIRVKLYPNHLPHAEGARIARASLKNRGGFTGNYDDLAEHLRQFFDESAYRLRDGFAVSAGCFSAHPNVGRTFGKLSEGHDGKRHPAAFRLHARAPSRNLADRIVVDVEGLADAASYIDEFVDIESDAVSGTLTPGGQFSVAGHKSEIAGDDAEASARFAPADDPSQRVKASGHPAESAASKLTGVIPPSSQIVTMAREQF